METTPKPFLRWAGGKQQLFPELRKRIPETWNRETDLYIEPFLGGGALFWELQPKTAVLIDSNQALIETYKRLRDDIDGVLGCLKAAEEMYLRTPKDSYASIRTNFNAGIAKGCFGAAQAAAFILLNKTCFNGLYRVNADGAFNTPWGHRQTTGLPSEEQLRACAAALGNITLHANDFAVVPLGPGLKGALIYADPPYASTSKTSDFTAYTAGGFPYVDQLRLAIWADTWRSQGAHVILSQAADEILIDQYRRLGFKCDKVAARRNINSKGSKRGPVGEYIIY